MWIGNDIIDLKDRDSQGKASQERFLKRVCSLEERFLVQKSLNPHIALWQFWAMKEATYKALKKKDSSTLFIPPLFVCHQSEGRRYCHADGTH